MKRAIGRLAVAGALLLMSVLFYIGAYVIVMLGYARLVGQAFCR